VPAEMVPTEVGILEPLQIRRSGRRCRRVRPSGVASYMFNQREAIRLEELRLTGGKTSIDRRQSMSRAANRTCRPLVLNIASPDCLGVLSKNASPRIEVFSARVNPAFTS
jgi:hypothetical protein